MMKKAQNTGEPMLNFFLVLDSDVFGLGVANPKNSLAFFFIVPSPTPTL